MISCRMVGRGGISRGIIVNEIREEFERQLKARDRFLSSCHELIGVVEIPLAKFILFEDIFEKFFEVERRSEENWVEIALQKVQAARDFQDGAIKRSLLNVLQGKMHYGFADIKARQFLVILFNL